MRTIILCETTELGTLKTAWSWFLTPQKKIKFKYQITLTWSGVELTDIYISDIIYI